MKKPIHSFSILIATDNMVEMQNLKAIIETMGYKAEYVKDYEELISRTKWYTFDLLLVDIKLAANQDYYICKVTNQAKKRILVPVVFLVSHICVEEITKGFEHGAVDYICRPFMPEELMLRLDLILQNKKQREKLTLAKIELESEVKKQTIKLQRAHKKLLKLDNAKNDFLRLVSHELQTPLNGLVGVMEILKLTGAEAVWQEYLDMIKPSVSRLTKFSKYAILITSILAGRKLKKRLVKIESLLTEALESIKNEAEAKNIEIVNYFSNEDVKVFVQKDYVVTCLSSILENAIKSTPNGGRVLIHSSLDYGKLNLHITDEGEGFSEEAQSKLYQIFSSENIMEHSEGLGLGLAAARLIMEAHKGSINIINSKEGVSVQLSFKKF